MKKFLQILLGLFHLIGFGFLGVAIYYLLISPYLEGEYMIGFGIGLLYGCTTLLVSSVVALVIDAYCIKVFSSFFKKYTQWMIGASFLIFALGVLYPFFTPVDDCLDNSGRWNYEQNICEYE
jgi:hypothetical protein